MNPDCLDKSGWMIKSVKLLYRGKEEVHVEIELIIY